MVLNNFTCYNRKNTKKEKNRDMKNILKLLCTSMVMAILISADRINNIHADQNEEIIGGDNAIVINDTLIETMSTSTQLK